MSPKNNIDFSDFFSHTTEDWKLQILKELKSDSENILIKHSEGLGIKGFYSIEDLSELNYLIDFHHQWLTMPQSEWRTIQYIPLDENPLSEELLLSAKKGGVNGYYFDHKTPSKSTKEIMRLLRNVDKSDDYILARTESSFYEFCECLKNVDNSNLSGLILTKSDYSSFQKSMDNLKLYEKGFSLLKDSSQFKCLGIDSAYSERNASTQIAASIAFAIELLDVFSEKGHSIDSIVSHMGFSFPIGNNYFIEISKLRAFRLVWDRIVNSMNTKINSFFTPVHCITIGQSGIDATSNLLHHTTQAMSAIIGGCNSLTILPSDIDSKPMNQFSSRMARNISILLKEEAHLNYTTDPAAGSYMIESLTHQIAEQALHQLKLFESHGGLINYLKKGNVL